VKPAQLRFLNALFRAPEPMTQARIQAAARISQASVSRYCNAWLKKRWLSSTEETLPRTGRPRTFYTLRKENFHVLAVHVDHRWFEIGLFDIALNPAIIHCEAAERRRMPLIYDDRWRNDAPVAHIVSRINDYLDRWVPSLTYADRLFEVVIVDNRRILNEKQMQRLAFIVEHNAGARTSVMHYPEALAHLALHAMPGLSGHTLMSVWLGGIDPALQHFQTGSPGGNLYPAPQMPTLFHPETGDQYRNDIALNDYYYKAPDWVRDGSITLLSSRQAKLEQQVQRLVNDLYAYSLDFLDKDIPIAGVIGGVWREYVIDKAASLLHAMHKIRLGGDPPYQCLFFPVSKDELLTFAARVAVARFLHP
jgi:hypothetical protein